MADIDLKTETPDTTLPTDGFLFGADSQSAASPSVYPVQSLATTLLGSTTLSGATVTTDAPVLDLSQTWNDAAVTFTGLKLNVTDTASAGASNLLDLRVGGTSRVIVSKSGSLFLNNSTMGISAATDRIIFGGNSQFAVRANSFGATLRENAFFGWTNSFDASAGTVDLGLTRRAAANLRLGFSDAAAPVAQTLSVQSVVAGTTDTAGANLTIAGSQGTGTGAGGSIVFRVAPAGASGTAQNALVDALTIGSDSTIRIPSTSSLYLDSSELTGIFRFAGGQIGFRVFGTTTVVMGEGFIGFRSSGNPDTILVRDAANTLALRNGTNAQESRIYGSYTSATNFQRLSIKTLRESSGALSGASYTTTIAIPAYAHLIGVTTRVTTEVTGATTYDVGDGSDVDLWGAAIGVTLGSQSRTADFTNIAAVGPAATARTVTLTANGSNFTAGVIEICLHYLTTEAD
jgi:hypothetical protein